MTHTTPQMYDFEDGNGPVSAHIHTNPDGSTGGWVANTAHVGARAYVGQDARVYGEAHVSEKAHVYGKAHVSGEASVYGKAHVSGEALVSEKAHVYGEAHVSGEAHVYGKAHVSGEALVYGRAHVGGEALVSGAIVSLCLLQQGNDKKGKGMNGQSITSTSVGYLNAGLDYARHYDSILEKDDSTSENLPARYGETLGLIECMIARILHLEERNHALELALDKANSTLAEL